MHRPIKITTDYICHPESSILIELGKTKVICNVTIENTVPPYQKDTGKGWVTAEYSMLPSATNTRSRRESVAGKITGRTAEIQRMIGRSFRAIIDLTKFDGYTAIVDCEVIQADGSTRTAAITGSAVALYLSFEKLIKKQSLIYNPMNELIAAVSVGIHDGKIITDLDYHLDSHAKVDMNVVMTESGNFVEIQGTGEEATFTRSELDEMLNKAHIAIQSLIKYQKEIIESYIY